MVKIDNIKINNIKYYTAEELQNKSPIYFKGCRSVRDIIKKKNIHKNEYIYAKKQNNVWTVADGNNKRLDKLLFTVEWTENTIPEFAKKQEVKHDIEMAPPIIDLEDEQKFTDDKGNVYEIMVRGERESDKCYFKVKDVMKEFEMPALEGTLTDARSSYMKKIHYTWFNCKITDTKFAVKKFLYLTYEGLLLVLFVSRTGNAHKFLKWAVNTLFTLQMGTNEQKNKLIAKTKGVSYESIQELFSIHARKMPCIYLTQFASVKNLRKKMNIGDDHNDTDIVYKFGLSTDFAVRKNGHRAEYKELTDCIDMTLVYYAYIDPLHIGDAETELKELLSDRIITYKTHKELIIIPVNVFKLIKAIYEKLAMKYSGHTESFRIEKTNLEERLKDMETSFASEKNKYEKEIRELTHEKEIQVQKITYDNDKYSWMLEKKDLEMRVKNSELEKRDSDLRLKISELEKKLKQNSNKSTLNR
jgi:hypothetical protein